MLELGALADTAGAKVAASVIQKLQKLNSATLIGEGKVLEIAELLKANDAHLVVFDEDLSGSQVRNLEELLPDVKVLDRTALILDIFARHAKTAESRLMVEIAQMQYMYPRLTNAWTHLSRQATGGTPGIGMRGPGEKQLEVDRRLVKKRILELKSKLKKIEQGRNIQAKNREGIFHIGIVGYTNAGKSTLVNRLTNAGVLAENKLFATLDSTTRRLFLSEGVSVLVSDTVGFIRKLPHHLMETFKSTLSVASTANCILEVVDSTSCDYEEQIAVTAKTLEQLVSPFVPHLLVFNKIDRISEEQLSAIGERYPNALKISSQNGTGIAELKQKLLALQGEWKVTH